MDHFYESPCRALLSSSRYQSCIFYNKSLKSESSDRDLKPEMDFAKVVFYSTKTYFVVRKNFLIHIYYANITIAIQQRDSAKTKVSHHKYYDMLIAKF